MVALFEPVRNLYRWLDPEAKVSKHNLIAACWTSAGGAVPCTDDERSPVPIRQRVEAVAKAGFTGFGLRHCDLAGIRDGIGYASLSSMLKDNGIGIVELEYLEDWFTDGDLRKVADQRRAELFGAAEALGARHIKTAGDFRDSEFNPERLAPHLERLAKDAANIGVLIGLEPTPYFDIKTPQDAVTLLEMVDHPSAGVFLDIWHISRMKVSMDSLRALPARWVKGVELDDALTQTVGTLIEDTINNRKLVGEGELGYCGLHQGGKGPRLRRPVGRRDHFRATTCNASRGSNSPGLRYDNSLS